MWLFSAYLSKFDEKKQPSQKKQGVGWGPEIFEKQQRQQRQQQQQQQQQRQ